MAAKNKKSKKSSKKQVAFPQPADGWQMKAVYEVMTDEDRAEKAKREAIRQRVPKSNVCIPIPKPIANRCRLVPLMSVAQLEKRIQESIYGQEGWGHTDVATGDFQIHALKVEANPMAVWAEVEGGQMSDGPRKWVKIVNEDVVAMYVDEILCCIELRDGDEGTVEIPEGYCFPLTRSYRLRVDLKDGLTVEIDDASQVQITRRGSGVVPHEVGPWLDRNVASNDDLEAEVGEAQV